MAAPLYGTPTHWKDKFIGGDTDPVVRLLAEIYNQLYSNVTSILQQFYATADGSGTYQNNALIGFTVLNIWADGVLLTPNTDYTVDASPSATTGMPTAERAS